MKSLKYFLPILVLVIISGCRKSPAQPASFKYPQAVIVAELGNETVRVAVNKTISPETKKYSDTITLSNGSIKIQYEFIGTAKYQADTTKDVWDFADDYVFNITQPGQPAQSVPFIYKGGNQTVYDRSNIRIILEQQ
jgi:hypothetical protein